MGISSVGLLGLLTTVAASSSHLTDIVIPVRQVVIQEQVKTEMIREHMHLWINEVEHSSDKLEKLMAAKLLRESNLLLRHILRMACGDEYDVSSPRNKPVENSIRRQKRNILGDFLHTLTGVATEEQLQAQVRLDGEIRDKIRDTLSRQVSFDRTISTIYGNLTREEEKIQERLDKLYTQRSKDRAQVTRLRVLAQVAKDDIEDMEDILDSLWTGMVGSRHAMKLSDMAGLSTMAKLKVESLQCGNRNPTIQYTTTLYQTQKAEIIVTPHYQLAKTDSEGYFLHSGHSLSHPLSTKEVTTTYMNCTPCAILVHLKDNDYRVAVPCELTCTNQQQMTIGEGSTITVRENETCWNTQMKLERRSIPKRIYKLNTSSKDRMDAIMLDRDKQREQSFLDNHAEQHQVHLLTALKMQHDLNLAQQDLDNFVADTQIDKNLQFLQNATSWGVTGAIGAVVIVIVLCIVARYLVSKRSSTNLVLAPPSTPAMASII